MNAMILAAGRGERLRPFTDAYPKPLIEIAGQPLIAHHLHALAAADFRDVVINIAYKGEQIRRALGDGRRYGVSIRYSPETPGALDTGGGIANALHLLDGAPFVVISADVFCDIDYAALPVLDAAYDMHAVLVDNPAHHPGGDFGLSPAGDIVDVKPRLTYAGIGIYRPSLFADRGEPRFAMSRVMREAIAAGRASGGRHGGRWIDVGRPATLARARQAASAR